MIIPSPPLSAIAAQAEIHHQWFLGLELAVATSHTPAIIEQWMFRLFRRQHEDKFLASFKKLGLENLPDAVACAKYHVLSNSMGGVQVEYLPESETKAWVRFRYPRWMYDGAVICGIPVEASRGFLKGWYAHNGVSLGNPRLGFVCVSEDMTEQFGLCGYFKLYDHDLAEDERLQFRPDERPPLWREEDQPRPPAAQWNAERLAKANRNYALDYLRNGLPELAGIVGEAEAVRLGKRTARLTGLQNGGAMAARLGVAEGDAKAGADFLAALFAGMGDEVERQGTAIVHQKAPRIVRGLSGAEREILLACQAELWRGMLHSWRSFLDATPHTEANSILWHIAPR